MLTCALLLSEAVLLFGGTVHTLSPGVAPHVADLLVEDGRISAIGINLEAPAGAERIDCTNKHLIPGLIDSYVNFDAEHDAYYISHGVTAVRDAGGEQVRLLAERMSAARDRVPGPMLVTAGALLDGDPPATPTAGIVRNASQAENLVPLLAQNGSDFISIHTNLELDAYTRVIEIAHELELRVWGPRPLAVSLDQALELGQDGFFGLDGVLTKGMSWHVREGVEALDVSLAALAQRVGANHTGMVPLLHASAVRSGAPSDMHLAWLTRMDDDYQVWWRGEWESRRHLLDNAEVVGFLAKSQERQRTFAANLLTAGADMVPGSAAPNPWLFPGAALHDELAAWEQAGIAPATILERVTREAARVVGLDDERGTLTVGRIADIVVVDADPTQKISTLRRPALVVVRGDPLDRLILDDLVKTAEVEANERRASRSEALVVAPLVLPAGHVVLSGRVHTVALTRTVTAERFAVVRGHDGMLIFVGRVVYPAQGGVARTMDVTQTINQSGRVHSFTVEVTSGTDRLIAEGLPVAGTLRVRRRLNDLPVTTDGTQLNPRAIDVGSITTMLALGQLAPKEQFPVMVFGESLEPQLANWKLGRDSRGVWQLITHRGAAAFELDKHGAPVQADVKEGRGLRSTILDEKETYGGAGLPASKFTGAEPMEAAAKQGGEAEAPAKQPTEGEGKAAAEAPAKQPTEGEGKAAAEAPAKKRSEGEGKAAAEAPAKKRSEGEGEGKAAAEAPAKKRSEGEGEGKAAAEAAAA